jgi:hypothetical protein
MATFFVVLLLPLIIKYGYLFYARTYARSDSPEVHAIAILRFTTLGILPVVLLAYFAPFPWSALGWGLSSIFLSHSFYVVGKKVPFGFMIILDLVFYFTLNLRMAEAFLICLVACLLVVYANPLNRILTVGKPATARTET